MRDWNMARTLLLVLAAAVVPSASPDQARSAAPGKPNIVYVLADDLGYGDVQCMFAGGKIATPEIDRLAKAGMIFTDAHTSSAVCTPTRYGVLTGRYNWRTSLQKGVLGGFSQPLINADRLTVASLLKQHGYATACVGKWHLGMNWPLKNGETADDGGDFSRGYADGMKVDYTAPIQDGPLDRGFDFFFGISASLDMPPYVFIRDRLATEIPTKEAALWPNRKGPVGDNFRTVDVLPRVTEEAVAFIDARAADAKAGKPFFLYMPLNSPHTPIVPAPQWQGKSGINDYADFVMQSDWSIGQVLAALDRHGIADDTLVIVTSDNGCSPQADFPELRKHGHEPSGVFRGHKADIYEGGHRVPFVVRWPGKVKPNTVCDSTVCLTDLMATCADIVGQALPANAGEDSVSLLPALLGAADAPLREATVHHSINGSFSIRQGDWKLALCPGSGGWSQPRPGAKATQDLPPVQLFDLAKDAAEQHNVADQHPDVVRRMTRLLEKYVAQGRSTPGSLQPNDTEIDIYKGSTPPALD